MLYWTDKDADPSTWKRKSRGIILGRWHQIKKELWERHLDRCEKKEEEMPFDTEEEVHRIEKIISESLAIVEGSPHEAIEFLEALQEKCEEMSQTILEEAEGFNG